VYHHVVGWCLTALSAQIGYTVPCSPTGNCTRWWWA